MDTDSRDSFCHIVGRLTEIMLQDIPSKFSAVCKESPDTDYLNAAMNVAARFGALKVLEHVLREYEWLPSGETLATAIKFGQADFAKYVVDLGIDLSANEGNWMEDAADNYDRDTTILEYIAEHSGSQPRIKEKLMHFVCEYGKIGAVKYLAGKGVNMMYNDGVFITGAVKWKHLHVVEFLCEHADFTTSALYDGMLKAIETEAWQIFKFLYGKIQSKLTVASRHELLHRAVTFAKPTLVEYLVGTCELDVKYKGYKIVRTAITRGGSGYIITYLLDHIQTIPMHNLFVVMRAAVQNENVLVLHELFRRFGTSLVDPMTILHLATSEGKRRSCGYLVNTHSRPFGVLDDMLIIACKKGYVDLVGLFLDHTADVNANTGAPIKEAAKAGHLPVVTTLLARGANVPLLSFDEYRRIRIRDPEVARALDRAIANANADPTQRPDNSTSRKRKAPEQARVDFLHEMLRDRLKDDDECPVRLENLKAMKREHVVFWPGCSHMMCIECYQLVDACPVCRRSRFE